MKYNQIKTFAYLILLTGLFLLCGWYLGGRLGLFSALFFSIFLNGIAYFYSDRIILTMFRAQPLDEWNYGWIYQTVQKLCQAMQIPVPKLWLIPSPASNAMATGRNPNNGSIALTSGIIDLVSQEELRAILAHELSHIKNRDILINSITGTLATGIGYIGNMFRRMRPRDVDYKERRGNPFARLMIAIVMPLAALLVRLAVSRSREYLADEWGSEFSQDPLSLASALEKLEESKKRHRFNPFNPIAATTAHLFIVNPFLPYGWRALFSTHPPVEVRISRLRQMYEAMKKR